MGHSSGVFFGKVDPITLGMELFFFFPHFPISVGHDFDQLPVVIGPSNLVCIFYGTFPRGVFWKMRPHYPWNGKFSLSFLIPPLSVGHEFN